MCKMIVASEGWPWDPERCPADQQFVEMVKYERLEGKSILHMGPGLHHHVGKELTDFNSILALTNSPDEMISYMELIQEKPNLSWAYKVLFGDMHTMNLNKLGKFDIVTLFHLGEYPVAEYAPLNVADVIGILMNNLNPRGIIVGYTGSSAWDRVGALFSDIADNYRMKWLYNYGPLKVWQAPL